MKIDQQTSAKGGKFFSSKDGKEVAEMTYINKGDDTIIIDHTFVDKAHREQGLGGKLVKAAVEFARKNSKKIIPQCPFARDEFKDKPSYSDVLK